MSPSSPPSSSPPLLYLRGQPTHSDRMENEAVPPKGKGLSATAPVFKFVERKEVPIEAQVAKEATTTFPANPESQEHTEQASAYGMEEMPEMQEIFETPWEPGKQERFENPEKGEAFVVTDDLYLESLLLEAETDGLWQSPSAVSTVNTNNHFFNSIIVPNFCGSSEKHGSTLGSWGHSVWATAVLDFAQWQNGGFFSGPSQGAWDRDSLHTSANLMSFQQQYTSVNSGALVRYASNQMPPYPFIAPHIYPLPIGQLPVYPGLGPLLLHPRAHYNAQSFPGEPQGYPQYPNASFRNETETFTFSQATFASSYASFAGQSGYQASKFSLSQEINQLHVQHNKTDQGDDESHNVSDQDDSKQECSGLPPLPDLSFSGRYEPEFPYIPEISRSHYTDLGPTKMGGGDGELEIKSRGIFLCGIPRRATFLEIFQNIRGGTIDQVSFQDREGPLMDMNIFFTTQKAAKSYFNYVKAHGGIFWYDERYPSGASLIPSQEDGFLNMDEDTAKAVADGFTRCVCIAGIPIWVGDLQLHADIQSQTNRFKIEYELFELRYVDSPKGRTVTAEIRFTSVKTCMSSIETLKRIDVYRGCVMTPVKDECSGPLSKLGNKWRMEYEWCKSRGIFRDQRFPITISRDKGGEPDREAD
ncbi:hypothetical protein HOY82DRAFT_598099 [Tuber indicum]|nr:hypothetical protein HOY82DRAFT_598099 [Tuber indicum]